MYVALPDHLHAKADPALTAADEAHFDRVATSLATTIDDLERRLGEARRSGDRTERDDVQEALDRDQEVRRIGSRLRALRRHGVDLCLGRMVHDDGAVTYVGRFGLADDAGDRLLVDWRSPAAEPFFGATHADPMGLASRRRYRWTLGRVTDFWDEVFSPDLLADTDHRVALDDQSAFIASLGASRSAQMRDVLGTIQADQDAIIRAGSRGTLVVDGGPGTGKTVVALHRAAYLLHADPRLSDGRGGVLFVGPHEPYLAYVADVMPSLGEDGVRTCTLRNLVTEGAGATPEVDPAVAALKADARMVDAIEPAVALYEEPPSEGMVVETEWAEVWVSHSDWAEAFNAADPGTPHNEARDEVWVALVDILVEKVVADLGGQRAGQDAEAVPEATLRRAFARHDGLTDAFGGAWPRIEAADLLGDLWSVPAYLRRCAPWLTPDEVRLLQRADAQAWTIEDLPMLDAARLRLGDPEASTRRRRADAEERARRAEMDDVVSHLVASDDTEMKVMSMLRVDDLQGALVDPAASARAEPDALAGPFAHVVVDEAQELSDAEWQMLLRRCPARSFTVVGDRAQARHGFTDTWTARLERASLHDVSIASLTINYRTPEEVMAAAEPVIRAVLPDANVPTSVRRSGRPVRRAPLTERDRIVERWLAEHEEGLACVIGDPTFEGSARVRSLSPVTAKGLEFDLVLLVDPDAFGDGVEGGVDRYVAMTRATQELVVLTSA